MAIESMPHEVLLDIRLVSLYCLKFSVQDWLPRGRLWLPRKVFCLSFLVSKSVIFVSVKQVIGLLYSSTD